MPQTPLANSIIPREKFLIRAWYIMDKDHVETISRKNLLIEDKIYPKKIFVALPLAELYYFFKWHSLALMIELLKTCLKNWIHKMI